MMGKIQKLLSLALVLVMLTGTFGMAYASSEATVSDSSAKFYKSASKSSDHVDIDKGAKVTVKKVSGDWVKVKYKGKTGYIRKDDLSMSSSSSSSSSSSKSWKDKVVKLRWFGSGKSVLREGHYGWLYDVKTGYKIKIKRMGGYNHADVEPATKSDARKLKKLGSSWDARPGILKVGDTYVACSFNTKAHGDQTIHSNGFNGQICLHMVGSKTHGGENVRSDHQSAIRRAYNWAH